MNLWKVLTALVRFMVITWGLLAGFLWASFKTRAAQGGRVQGLVTGGNNLGGFTSLHSFLARCRRLLTQDPLSFTLAIPWVFLVPQKAWDWQLMQIFQEESSETEWHCVLGSQIFFLENIAGLVLFFFKCLRRAVCMQHRTEKWNSVISIWSILIEKPQAFAWNSLTL